MNAIGTQLRDLITLGSFQDSADGGWRSKLKIIAESGREERSP